MAVEAELAAVSVSVSFDRSGHTGFSMPHPEHAIVGLLSVALAGVGTLFALAAGWTFWLNTSRILPSQRSRSAYWVGVTFFALVILPSVGFATIEASKAVPVIASFGWDAYSDGLRVVNKHGLLSDGRYLSAFWTAAIVPMMWTTILVHIFVAMGWHMHFHPPRVVAEPSADRPENRPAEPASGLIGQGTDSDC